jgi:hypothetical protein
MGLSIAIAGAIVLSVLMLVLMTMTGFVGTMFSIGDVSTQVSQHDNAITKTDVSISRVEALVGSPLLNFTLNNDGSEKLWNYDDFDLFIEYNGATSGKLLDEFSYSGDCLGVSPAVGKWCIESITGDVMDPGLLNGGERAEIWTQLSENLADKNAYISIATDNGETASVPTNTCGNFCYQMIWTVVSDAEDPLVWNNMGSGAGVADELDDNSDHRAIIDLIDMKEWRIISISVDSQGSAICELGVQYSTDNMVTWRGLDNGNVASLSTASTPCDTAGHYVSSWTSINATAQADVWLRIAGTDNDGGGTDPDFGNIQVQFRS